MRGTTFSRFAFAAILAFNVGTASATPTKCQGKLEKAGNKFSATVSKSLQKCIDTAMKAVEGGSFDQKVSDTCEKAIDKINAARTKSLDGCLTSGCTASELSTLGHLISGVNGPQGIGDSVAGIPNGLTDFACTAVIAAAESLGIQNTIQESGLTQELLLAAVAADAANTATDLETYVNALPRCNTHACVLTSSNATLKTTFATLPLTVEGSIPLDICTPVGGAGISTDAKIIRSAPSRSVKPVTGLPGGLVACATTVRAEGACDCGTGVAWVRDYALCRDSDLSDTASDECSVAPYGLAAGYVDTGSSPDENGGNVYQNVNPTNAMTIPTTSNGDCTGTLSVSFRVVSPLQVGTDGVACTNDDTVAPGAAQALPFTTGVAQATVLDGQLPGNTTTLGDIAGAQVTGSPIASCTSLESSNLSNLKLVGSAPVLDEGDSTLGDNVLSLELTCD